MPSLHSIATIVIFGGFGYAWLFHSIAARLVDSPKDPALDNFSLRVKEIAESPASRWVIRRNLAIAVTVIGGLVFGITLNFVA